MTRPAETCLAHDKQIYAVGHPVDPEERKGTSGSLIVKPVRVSRWHFSSKHLMVS